MGKRRKEKDMAEKRSREDDDDHNEYSTTMAAASRKSTSGIPPLNKEVDQYIEERSEKEKIVRNSPYGKDRSALGWGTPFKAGPRCTIPGHPNIRIGLSSLNAIPRKGTSEDMGQLLGTYVKKFNTLEHCNPYHRMGEEEQWNKWRSLAQGRDFIYTVKSNKFLTHTKMLDVDEECAKHIETFFE